MKVTGYRTRILHTPADDPLANSLPDTGRETGLRYAGDDHR